MLIPIHAGFFLELLCKQVVLAFPHYCCVCRSEFDVRRDAVNYSNGGFGNTKEQEQESSDFWGSFSSGWSSFTETASNLAANASERAQHLGSQFQENVWKPTKEKVRRKLKSIFGFSAG